MKHPFLNNPRKQKQYIQYRSDMTRLSLAREDLIHKYMNNGGDFRKVQADVEALDSQILSIATWVFELKGGEKQHD